MANPRLKVFSWSDGFHAFTVAAPSRPKALEAWGMGRDIFKDGLARQIERGPDFDAAMAAPGEVIQRGEAIDRGKLGKPAKPKPGKTPRSTAVDKTREALQTELETLDQAWADADADLTKREAELSEERERLEKRHQKARADVQKKLGALR